MSSQTQRDREPAMAPDAHPAGVSGVEATAAGPTRGRDHRRWPLVLLAVLLVLVLAGGVYLALLARAWEERTSQVDAIARELGAELAESQAELEETQGTLALVESQLDGAQQQIHELADTAAQFGDDREIQRQVAEYQAELFGAATAVTGTMGECISAQTEYTLALEDELSRAVTLLRTLQQEDEEDPDEQEEQPAPDTSESPDLVGLREEVVDSCQAAAEAHSGLQQRLGDT